MRKDAVLSRSLTLLTTINDKLKTDAFISLEQLRHHALAFDSGKGNIESVEFWLKTAVRTFTAQVEGNTFAMRSAVLNGADVGLLSLGNRTRAILAGLRYHKSTDTVLEKRKGYPFEMNIRFAFEYFPRLFGSDWKLNVESAQWDYFKEFIWARNRITHPEFLEDFYPAEALSLIFPSFIWFLFSMFRMLEDCGSKLGVEPRADRENLVPLDFPQGTFTRIPRDPSFYNQVAENGRALQLAIIAMKKFREESTQAWTLWLKGITPPEGMSGVKPLSSFGARILVRTYFSEIEGLTFSWRRVLIDAEKRSEISLTKEERQSLFANDICERLTNTALLFSQKLGYGRTIDTSGEGYRSLEVALRFRNRITHPRRLEDFEVKPGTVKSILNSKTWFGQLLEAVEVAPHYWER